MGKATVGLVGGYWPEDVARYIAAPRWALDEGLVGRPARQWPDDPALAYRSAVISYRELDEGVGRIAAGLQREVEPGGRIGLLVQSPVEFVRAFLGALRGGYAVYLMDSSQLHPRAGHLLAEFGAGLLLCDEASLGLARAVAGAVPVTLVEGLQPQDVTMRRARVDVQAPTIALADEAGRLIFHSHHSLLAGAISWATFTSLAKGQAVLCGRPLCTWEGLYSMMSALMRGGLCLFSDLDDRSWVENLQRYRPVFVIVDAVELERMFEERPLVRAIGASVAGVYVTVRGPFSVRWRRRARNRLRTEILTTFGSARLGAVVAAHPSWYEDSALGIPVTNVDLWPLDPITKEALDVSWEAVEYAEIGVKSPMIAPSGLAPSGRWHPTGLVATVDPNGFYYLLEKPADWLKGLGLALPVLDTAVLSAGWPQPSPALPLGPIRPYEPPTLGQRSPAEAPLHLRVLQEIARLRFNFPTSKYPDYSTYLNHPQRTMGVQMPDGSVAYPDIVVVQSRENYARIVAQVETSERINDDVASYEWRPYSTLAPLYLYVPVEKGEEALSLCRRLGIPVVGIRTWRYDEGERLEIYDLYEV